jgi:hypothetical protein
VLSSLPTSASVSVVDNANVALQHKIATKSSEFVELELILLNKSILMSLIVLTIILRTLNERSDLLMVNNFTVFLEIIQA